MDLTLWIVMFAALSAFWSWILFFGGAERLEGSLISGVLLWYHAPEWTAEGIRLFALCMWIGHALWFVLGFFVPALRYY